MNTKRINDVCIIIECNDYFYIELLKYEYNLYKAGGKKAQRFIPDARTNNRIY